MNFDWNKLSANLQKDALSSGSKKTYEVDERFYKLGRDEQDNGGALIRFIPDAFSEDAVPFVKMTKINARQTDGSKRFVSDWSPQTILKPDPFNERFLELWNEGKKEEAKKYSRAFRYLANIVVVKDPKNPENNNKVFLLDMSPTLFAKVKDAMMPSESELALGAEAKQVFNPMQGNNFLLKVAKAATGFLSYETSKFDEKESTIYTDEAAAKADISANAHSLNEFLNEKNFKTYDELVDKMAWFDGDKNPKTVAPSPEQEVAAEVAQVAPTPEPVVAPTPAPAQSAATTDSELDDLLDDL